jgi:hypothetical protein
MGDIYTNSFCNIAATSNDHSKGCFRQRDTSVLAPFAISDPQPQNDSSTHIIGYDDFWSNSLLDSTLHRRGWALQERLLSPRTIHLGQDQLFWECRSHMACEIYPRGIPEPFRNWRTRSWRQVDQILDPINRPKPKLGLLLWLSSLLPAAPERFKSVPAEHRWVYGNWSRIVEAYMDCKLTFAEDKLCAISGVAQRVAEATNERYLAGLWDAGNSMLASSLLWYVSSRKQADGTTSIRTAPKGHQGYRAPSWSWASLDAKIIWNWPSECDDILIDILRTNVRQLSSVTLGKISSAEMHIQGRLFEANLYIVSTLPRGSLDEGGRYAMLLKNFKRGKSPEDSYAWVDNIMTLPMVYLDTPLLPDRTSTDVYLLPICTGWRDRTGAAIASLAGLLLKKAGSKISSNEYVRIGIFGMNHGEASALYGLTHDGPAYLDKRFKDFTGQYIVLV